MVAPALRGDGRLRVCLVTSTLPMGGAESVQLAVLTGLDPARFECQVLCLRDEGVMAESFRREGIPVTTLDRHGLQHLWSVPVVAQWLRRRRIDIMLATTHLPSLHVSLVAARLGRVRASVLGLHQTRGRSHGLPSLPSRTVDVLWLLDALVLLSEEQREYITECESFGSRPWRRAPVAVIPNGVVVPPMAGAADRERARRLMGVPVDAPVIACIAALRPEKSHLTLLRAIARLVGDHPDLRLVLVGDGPERPMLEGHCVEAGIEANVTFAGFRDDVAHLLPGVDILCLTSSQETYPMAPLEAMAAGVPVVMTRSAGVPTLVEDGVSGFMVEVGDDAAAAERLGTLLRDAEMGRAMGAKGRERVARTHTRALMVERYAALFEHLAGRDLPARPGIEGRLSCRVRRIAAR